MNQECNASKKVHLRQCHCFNLRQVTLAVTALYDKYLQEAGITAQQYSILWHSKELGPLSITELASAMNLDRTTLSRNITLLTKRGLLETLPSTGRRRLVQLTGQGQAVFAQAYESWQQAQQQLESRLGKKQMSQLEDLLAQLMG
ncbi:MULTISPECIES: MarR family winged helix-turn-helix transcriptional regulator [Megasphaera]|uniref:MarR family transcriptional regulator n=2 Tax=Megasphaera TaxID=906 RepID=A0A848EQC8_MEGEL|nr:MULTISPECIES: MarR family transcriptional regulator [Megasphaera]MBM6702624.1 MarR family transcriptional regulator [Megasphaera elsdenii]MCI6925344.1 MarR family transcriptional regulator [Megasphaera elsdenii]MCI7049433.1 MarR family transcriptional regulator [Megasphaera elsdenii]MCI7060542.1 MarR family transcriptional regulator [Megasphaera elsdenii]MCI7544855.1 MarR family transcriptional regulator [Megasphaera elsdenii]